MNKMVGLPKYVFAGASLLAFVAPNWSAGAADLLPPPPQAPMAMDWSGPSIGFSISNLWGTGTLDAPGVAKLDGLSLNGPAVGLTLGYDYEFAPGLVVGGAADLNLSDTRFSMAVPGESLTVRDYANWALRGRLGTEVGPGTLAYGTVGFSELIGDASLNGAVNGSSGRQTYNGVVFGLGLETRFDTNMFARFEYLHGIYGRQSYAGGAFGVAPSTDSARFTLVFRPDDSSAGASRPVSAVGWNGAYIGGMGGWENARATAAGPNGFSVAGIGGSGPEGGVVAGFNWAGQNAIAGVEGEASANSAHASLSSPAGAQVQASLPYELAARVRFGAPVAANTMLYAAVGGVWTRANGLLTVPGATVSAGQNYAGVQFGLGMETMLTSHIGARIEYLESRYAKQNYLTPSSGTTQSGLIYKF